MTRFAILLLLISAFVSSVFASAIVLNEPVHSTDSWSYDDCGTQSDYVVIKSIRLSPDPPKPGNNLTVTVNADVNRKVVEGAYANVSVKLGVIKLIQKTFDLCEEARNAKTSIQCPVEPGPYVVEQNVLLPKEIPRGKFSIDVKGFAVDDKELFCLVIKVNFLPRFPHFDLWTS